MQEPSNRPLKKQFVLIRDPSRVHSCLNVFVILCLLPLLSGCQILNTKWIRIHRGKNPDVTRIKLRVPNFVGPKERVERFFQAYQRKDWKDMESSFAEYSDLRFIKESVRADFVTYSEIVMELETEAPTFNEAEDKAQVRIKFSIEKIHHQTGALTRIQGRGSFVLTEKGRWDLLGYAGDPFWNVRPK